MEKETCEDSTDPVWLEVVPQEEENGDVELSGDDGASVSFSRARQLNMRIWADSPRIRAREVRRNMEDSREQQVALEYSTLWQMKKTPVRVDGCEDAGAPQGFCRLMARTRLELPLTWSYP